jgi:hypothetical protein
MAFYMSPLVDVIETDLSDVIPAVSTNVSCILLRNTKKGPELQRKLITTVDQLKNTFGETTDNYMNVRDMLSAIGFLLNGRQLYCTRVLADDATFAGKKVSATGLPIEFDTPYILSDFSSENPDYFHEEQTVSDENEILWAIASSRGEWGNDVRFALCNKSDFDDITKGEYPSGWSVPASASDSPYYALNALDENLDEDTDFIILVETKNRQGNWVTEDVFNVSTKDNAIDDQGRTKYVETKVNEDSETLRVTILDSLKGESWPKSTEQYIVLKGGSLGSGLDDYESLTSNLIDALSLYSNPEELDINLFIDSDKPSIVKKQMITICETRKDCMAVLDPPIDLVVNNRGSEATDLTNWRQGIGTFTEDNLNVSTSYASLYGNWLEVHDPYKKKYQWTPASGYVAGVYAKTDNVNDPWWAPAGFRRAQLLGKIRKLAWNPDLGKRDLLYKYGVNPIVSFAGEGKVILGQKTLLSRSSAFNRVNVRRLFITIEKAVATSAKYFLFEPNDGITRNQIVDLIEPFLRDVQARRGVYDFDVICDERNNTPIRIDRNELHAAIMIQPVRASEFIILNFVATATGASFEEAFKAVS